jgi:hypothetical protein
LKPAAGEQMKVEMLHAFSRDFTIVGDPAKTIEFEVRRDPAGRELDFSQKRSVLLPGFGKSGDMLPGNDKDMHGRHWIKVMERHDIRSGQNLPGGNLPGYNAAENAVHKNNCLNLSFSVIPAKAEIQSLRRT